jgi:hypothetical protein
MRHDTGRAWLRRTLLLVVALMAQVVTTHAHGGLVQLHQAVGPFVITVFTAPTPLRVGPVDISVLVQDREDGQPLLDGEVSVWLRRDGGRTVGGPATRAVAHHKLLYGTVVHLPEAGPWVLEVTVRQGQDSASVRGQVSAAAPRPFVLAYWRSLSLPPIIITLFAMHQWVKRRAVRRGKAKLPTLSERQIDILLAGGAINRRRERQSFASRDSKRPYK